MSLYIHGTHTHPNLNQIEIFEKIVVRNIILISLKIVIILTTDLHATLNAIDNCDFIFVAVTRQILYSVTNIVTLYQMLFEKSNICSSATVNELFRSYFFFRANEVFRLINVIDNNKKKIKHQINIIC